jgi:hypothetical protein
MVKTVWREKMDDALGDAELLEKSQVENWDKLPDYEIRRLSERSQEYLETPPWEVLGYAPTRQYACIIAEALNR